jgi:hemin uptake protein HemP
MIDEHNENYYRLFVDKMKSSPAIPVMPPKVKSETLLGLRVTQNGKLILTA